MNIEQVQKISKFCKRFNNRESPFIIWWWCKCLS